MQIVPLGLERWAGVEVIRLLLLSKQFEEISEKVVNNVHLLLDFYLNFVMVRERTPWANTMVVQPWSDGYFSYVW